MRTVYQTSRSLWYTQGVRRTFAASALAAAAVAVGVWLVHGPGSLGYDALWALEWGGEAMDGHAPSYEGEGHPTPHPLLNAVAALLMLAGSGAAGTALLALSWLSLGALAVFLARLGAALLTWPVGLLAAALVLTRSLIVLETAQAVVDVAFLALAVAALDREVRNPREGLAVPILLVLAGLLRPEGWGLALAYLVYRREPRLAPLLALAPALWALTDLWATGDPLHSLHGTQELGEALGRPRSVETALTSAPTALRELVQEPLLYVALTGAAAGLVARVRESALPAALVVLGLAGFLVLGLTDLPLLGRYLLLPACMLLLFAGVAVFGWVDAPSSRRAWQLGGVLAAAVVLAGVPGDVGELDEVADYGALRAEIQDDLREAVEATEDLACAGAVAPDLLSRAVVTLYREEGGPSGRLEFAHADPQVAQTYGIGPLSPPEARGRVVYEGRWWRAVAERC